MLAKKDARDLGKPEPQRDVAERFRICDESNNYDKMSLQDFLYGHVPWSYGLWQLRRYGLVLPNPEVKSDKGKVLVGGFSYLYKEKIEKSITYANLLLETEKAWRITHANK